MSAAHRQQPVDLGEPAVVADGHAQPAELGVEHRQAQVARFEIQVLVAPQVQLAVGAQIALRAGDQRRVGRAGRRRARRCRPPDGCPAVAPARSRRARWGRPALSRPARRLPRGFRTCNRYWPARAAPPAARPGRRPVRPAPRRAPRWRRPRPSPGPSAHRRSANRRRADAAGRLLHAISFISGTERDARSDDENKAPDHALRAYRGFLARR